ncbi:MAG: mechanosensitive ion channel family protein [Methanoregulaceae archaeon]|nr:mechanosensitive ion channel family protein [Methanoregulaceae archaeon]
MTINDIILGLLLIGLGVLLGFVLSRITIRFTKPFAGIARGKSLGRVVQWLTVVIFGLIGGLVLFGVSETTVAIVIGALTFALTFGAQNVIQNFVAGLLIAIDGRLQIGQWVEIGDRPDQTGPAEVLDLSLQMVKIRESGGKVYFVPNSYIFTHKLLNFSESGYLEVQVPITLPYQEDSERVKKVLIEVARESPYVFPQAKRSLERMVKLPAGIEQMNTNVSVELPPEQMFPVVRMVKATQDGVDFLISLWTPFPEMRNEIVSEYLQRSIERLMAENVSIKDNSVFPAAPRPGSPGSITTTPKG